MGGTGDPRRYLSRAGKARLALRVRQAEEWWLYGPPVDYEAIRHDELAAQARRAILYGRVRA